jgi:hypothetical protein
VTVVVEFISGEAKSFFITDCGLLDLLLKLCFSDLITFSLLFPSLSITNVSSDTKIVFDFSLTLEKPLVVVVVVDGVLIDPVLVGGFLITGGFCAPAFTYG